MANSVAKSPLPVLLQTCYIVTDVQTFSWILIEGFKSIKIIKIKINKFTIYTGF